VLPDGDVVGADELTPEPVVAMLWGAAVAVLPVVWVTPEEVAHDGVVSAELLESVMPTGRGG
jgi:hypothetical protein